MCWPPASSRPAAGEKRRATAAIDPLDIVVRTLEPEVLGAFDLAQLWADRTAWPLNERTPYDELAELACMSALAA